MDEKIRREEIAELCHRQWTGWMEYLFKKCDMIPESEMYATSDDYKIPVIHADLYRRWKRQIETEYKDLSEKEKESDRIEADKFLSIIDKERKEAVRDFAEKVLEYDLKDWRGRAKKIVEKVATDSLNKLLTELNIKEI